MELAEQEVILKMVLLAMPLMGKGLRSPGKMQMDYMKNILNGRNSVTHYFN
ncbi:hypothetical protein D1872_323610 [compost metagenome]